jgi:hypothetical protein
LFNLLNFTTMKKLILSASALFLSLGYASAQATTTGAQDAFATSTEVTGIAWDAGTDFTMTRAGDFTLKFADANASGGVGGKNSGVSPSFRATFANPLDLTNAADVQIDITNGSAAKLIMKITLEDGNGTQATIEPNISDVTSNLGWGDAVNGKYPRKADNGFVLAANTRATYKIDLSSVAGSVGGLTRTGWIGDNGCSFNGPYCGPVTSYDIDIDDIVAVVFIVNFDDGRYMLSMGVGDGDHTDDYIIADPDHATEVVPFNGTITLHDFKVGDVLSSATETSLIDNSLKVYPNPAKDALNVSFETMAGAEVTLSSVVGNEVYSATANAGENKITVNTADLPQGLYIVNVATETGKVARKVMIK